MRVTLIAVCFLSIVLLSTIKPSKSECCHAPFECKFGKDTSYKCYDCTETSTYCGVGKCNIFGCNCDDGCRKGDSTLDCWKSSSGCFRRSFNGNDVFTAIDTDSDGKVSLTEAKNYLFVNLHKPTGADIGYEFKKLDSNGDGFLQFNEIDS